jgi:hypothetical protein
MANLAAGGADGFYASLWGLPHPSTLDFIQRKLHQTTESLTAAGQQFMMGAQALYERYNGDHALRLMAAAARTASHFWQSNNIRYLGDIGSMQQAPLVMQRWVMAEPMVRQMYHDNRLDGYSHSYVDMHPGMVGEQHYDWRRVMSGVVEFKENGDWYARTYCEDLLPDDVEPTMLEKHDVLETWWAIRQQLEAGKDDPTSVFNAELE